MAGCARAIVRQLDELGWDHAMAELCKGQIATIRTLDNQHAELPKLEESYAAAQRKYGIAN
jgi:hypothetical protein